jgi:hypothetical protein
LLEHGNLVNIIIYKIAMLKQISGRIPEILLQRYVVCCTTYFVVLVFQHENMNPVLVLNVYSFLEV